MSAAPDHDTIRERVVGLVREFAPELPEHGVSDASRFVEDLGYHSLALVELSFAIEDEYLLDPITADEVEDVQRVGDLVAFLHAKIAAGTGPVAG